jgi:predicted nucleic acid-binding protein
MNIFFDTSSLFKLYHKEVGTQELMGFFNNNTIDSVFLAEITRIEFSSVVWKKCRKKEIDEKVAGILIEKFEKDSQSFSFVTESDNLRKYAKELIAKHWKKGLRTLDSIQLASVLTIKPRIEIFFTSDVLLSEIAVLEGLKIQ